MAVNSPEGAKSCPGWAGGVLQSVESLLQRDVSFSKYKFPAFFHRIEVISFIQGKESGVGSGKFST